MSTYEKKTWINNETKVNATNMNHIEEGIYTNSVEIEELKNDKQEINYEALTYAELKVLKDNNELTPNKAYRITDYVTKVNGKINNISDLARSMEHPFDIFVLATSTNNFSEDAFACLHEGDTYFANSDLSSWKLWYCFENDTNRFEWADTENGKGVIYRMIDEFENDIPYDFKNVQFKRYKITGTTDSRQEAFIGKYYAFNGTFFATYDTSDFQWYYTCSDVNGDDLSIQNIGDHSYALCKYVKQLKIGQYLSDEPNYRGVQALNDIVLVSPSMIVDLKFGEGSTKNTLIGSEDMTYSYFGEMCRRNIICGELSHNRCQECFQENLIGTGNNTDETFHFVRTGRHFQNNIIIKMSSTIFLDATYNNIFANKVLSCNFSSITNNNDYSGLNEMQYCNIQRTYNTKFFGTGSWIANQIGVLQSCEIHADNLYGCSFGFLQQVKFINSDSATLNIVNMEFDTLIGLPTTIDFALLLPYNLHGTRSFKKLCCAKINTGTSSNTNKIEYTCENVEDGKKAILGAYSDDNGVTWLPLEEASGGASNYIITELPTENIDENGNYFMLTDFEEARGYLSTDTTNLSATDFPPKDGASRSNAVINSVDYELMPTTTVAGEYRGSIAIKFNIPCDVTITLNPRQQGSGAGRFDFFRAYQNDYSHQLLMVSAGEVGSLTKTFSKDEILCLDSTGYTNGYYYKLQVSPHLTGDVILKSNEVNEYIRYDGVWLKNSGENKLYRHTVNETYAWISATIETRNNTPFTMTTLAQWLYDNGYNSMYNRYTASSHSSGAITSGIYSTDREHIYYITSNGQQNYQGSGFVDIISEV